MSDIDFYSHTRALRSIRRADVVLLLIDSLVPVAEVDLKLARAVQDEYKPVVLTVNKWDLAHDAASPAEFGGVPDARPAGAELRAHLLRHGADRQERGRGARHGAQPA